MRDFSIMIVTPCLWLYGFGFLSSALDTGFAVEGFAVEAQSRPSTQQHGVACITGR
jgi:hypothetical protein